MPIPDDTIVPKTSILSDFNVIAGSIGPNGELLGQFAQAELVFSSQINEVSHISVTYTGSLSVQMDGSSEPPNPWKPTSSTSSITASTNTIYGSVKRIVLTISDNGSGANTKISGITVGHREMNDESDHTACNPNAEQADRDGGPHTISLRYGEKRETFTDLRLASPSNPLTFTRTYRQYLQADLNFMGRGWSHNHHYRWTEDNGANTVIIQMPDGGKLFLDAVEPGWTYFRGRSGLHAELYKWVDIPEKYYELRMLSGDIYIFNKSGNIVSHKFPNGDIHTYEYFSDPNQSNYGLLQYVEDNYGNRLKFRYYHNPGSIEHQKLWRVADQNTLNIGNTNPGPNGRYLAFTYYFRNGQAYLRTFRDLRGFVWRYSHASEGILYQGNTIYPMTEQESPNIIASSTGYINDRIYIKRLEYTWENDPVLGGKRISKIEQYLGKERFNTGVPESSNDDFLLHETYTFVHNKKNARTKVKVADRTTRYDFDYGVYYGMTDPTNSEEYQWLNGNYRVKRIVDGNNNQTNLTWNDEGFFLNQVDDAENNPTEFVYENDDQINGRLLKTTDASGRITRYLYHDTNNPRLPTVVRILREVENVPNVVIKETHFEYDSKGHKTVEREYDPADGKINWNAPEFAPVREAEYTYHVSNGMLASIVKKDLVDTTNNITLEYSYDNYRRVIQVRKVSFLGSCQFTQTIYDDTDNVVATICGHTALGLDPWPTSASAVENIYDSNDPDKHRVTIFVYDELGRRIQEQSNVGSANEETKLIFFDAMNRVTRTITNYDSGTLVNPQPALWYWNENSGTQRWQVSAVDSTPITHGTYNDRNLIEDTSYNALGEKSQTRDTLGRVTIFGYDDAGRLKKVVRNAANRTYLSSTSGLNGVSTDSYIENTNDPDVDIITKYQYDAAGNRIREITAKDSSAEQVKEIRYTALNRPDQITMNPAANGTAEEMSLPDQHGVQRSLYDEIGRVYRTQILAHRPKLNDGTVIQEWRYTLYGYDDLGRLVKRIENPSVPDFFTSASNPAADLSNYSPANGADETQDITTVIAYDGQGRVKYEQDAQGRRNWHKYDGLGRKIKEIINAQGDESSPTTNPRSDQYIPSSDSDKDLITVTEYRDESNQPKRIVDPFGRVTLFGHDTVGRVVRVIQNASAGEGQLSDLSDYLPAPNATVDQDQITDTLYDSLGRPQQTTDPKGNRRYIVYDTLNRQIKQVLNYYHDGQSTYDDDPASWIWSETNQRWQDNQGNPIDHGSDIDRNIITETIYTLAGEVTQIRRPSGQITCHVLDRLGRVVLKIDNFSATTNPAAWTWDEFAKQWEDGNGTPIDHATHKDQNLITATTYNKVGWVTSIRDPKGILTTFDYDLMGRQRIVTRAAQTMPGGSSLTRSTYTAFNKIGDVLRSIDNWKDSGISPDLITGQDTQGNWIWAFNPNHYGLNDENLITTYSYDLLGRPIKMTNPNGESSFTVYNKDGTVARVTNANGIETAYRYDGVGRRTWVVENFVEQGQFEEWRWNETTTQWEES